MLRTDLAPVPIENSIRSGSAESSTLCEIIVLSTDEPASRRSFCLACLKFSDPRQPADRGSRSPSPAGRSASQRAIASAPPTFRPAVCGPVVALLVGLAQMSADRSTCHSDRLASESLRLGMGDGSRSAGREDQAWRWRFVIYFAA